MRRRPSPLPVRAAGFVHRLCLLLALGITLTGRAGAQARPAAPDSLSSAEFWAFFTSMSEPDGYFLSENFVSNEISFQDVIPTLQRTLAKDGVYLGVGPEQNFTYIANLAPRVAVIFDIRRQNAMQHLMYKALFELSATRAEFVARLFSRPAVARLGASMPVNALFDSAGAALPDDSAFTANLGAIVQRLTETHGFALTAADIASIEHVYNVFFTAGPDVNYGYRSGSPAFVRTTYPTFGMLQSTTSADSVQMAFLATEGHYQAVRRLQQRNLIIPVVGDFGGPKAIRAVGEWVRERRMTVAAFYVSNVEQYLFRDQAAADRFYGNVSSLPIDTASAFIRSVPRTSGSMPMMTFTRGGSGNPGMPSYIITRDAVGNLVTQTFRDSAGVTLMQTRIDSARRDSAGTSRLVETTSRVVRDSSSPDTGQLAMLRRMIASRDSIIRLNSTWQVAAGPARQVVMGGLLTSGIASMRATLDAFFLGELKSYNAIIDMTTTSGWKR